MTGCCPTEMSECNAQWILKQDMEIAEWKPTTVKCQTEFVTFEAKAKHGFPGIF